MSMSLAGLSLEEIDVQINYHVAKLDGLTRLRESIVKDTLELRREEMISNLTVKQVLGEGKFMKSLEYFDIDDQAGIIYKSSWFIMIYEDEYSLLMGNQEITSQCLFELEERLKEYVLDEMDIWEIEGLLR